MTTNTILQEAANTLLLRQAAYEASVSMAASVTA